MLLAKGGYEIVYVLTISKSLNDLNKPDKGVL